jgi:hypothetical protein
MAIIADIFVVVFRLVIRMDLEKYVYPCIYFMTKIMEMEIHL